MADESGDKTEEPTAHRLQEARRKGEVAQSRDLAAACVLLAAFAVASFQAADLATGLVARTGRAWSLAVSSALSPDALLRVLLADVGAAVEAVLPLLCVAAVAGGAALFLQSGAVFTTKKLEPKLDRLNVVAGFKNKFLKARTYVDFLKTLVKLAVVAIIAWTVVRGRLGEVLQLSRLEPAAAAVHLAAILKQLLVWTLGAFFAIGAVDLFYQRFQFLRDQRMSKEEVKREYKEQEGDPEQKHRLLRARMERMQAAMFGNLLAGGADAVIVNPTHIACALRFDPDKESVPRLVAKGRGAVAQRIREICEQKKIPVRRDVALARTLEQLDLWEQIPEELYEAAREVLLWVAEEAEQRGEIAPWRRRWEAHEDRSPGVGSG